MLTSTGGSLAVDEDCHVLDEHGRAVAGAAHPFVISKQGA
jgi:hypothetical protein